MPVDHLRYDILAQTALRGMVRGVLADVARKGLPGDHHFYVTFDTRAEGVRLSPRLLEQYPEQMTIVLQHQFWDLKVSEEALEVGLSFSGVAEKLIVPFEAITAFVDPSVQFALQFETIEEGEEQAPGAEAKPKTTDKTTTGKTTADRTPAAKPQGKPRPPARHVPAAATPAEPAPPPGANTADDGPGGKPGGEVVRLDRFRKK